MGKWGVYSTAIDFFNNLQINDKIKYNKGHCVCEGEIVSINKPIKSCKVMKVTKKTEMNVEQVLTTDERIMILPAHAENCESI